MRSVMITFAIGTDYHGDRQGSPGRSVRITLAIGADREGHPARSPW
jgi:hypothetical protein